MFTAYIKCKCLSGNMCKCFKGFCRSRRGAAGGHREMFVESQWKVSVHFGRRHVGSAREPAPNVCGQICVVIIIFILKPLSNLVIMENTNLYRCESTAILTRFS